MSADNKEKLHLGVFCASPHDGNTMDMTDKVMEVLEEADLNVERLNIMEIQDDISGWGGGDYLPEGESMPDGMQRFIDFCEEVDALIILSPIWFSSPPAQFKAIIDHLQPLWSERYLDGTRPEGQPKPLLLFMLGGGPDPYGYEPMITITQSGMELFDYRLIRTTLLKGYRVAGDNRSPESFEERAQNVSLEFVKDLQNGEAQKEAEEVSRAADPRKSQAMLDRAKRLREEGVGDDFKSSTLR